MQGKDLTVRYVLFCYGHFSLSLNTHFMSLVKLLMPIENKLKRKHAHIGKVRSLSKKQKKMDNFFLKEF